MKREFWLVIIATVIVTFAQYFFKAGAEILPRIGWQIPLAVILMGSVMLLMFLALRKAELSYAYPLLATSFIWVGFIGYFTLGEAMSVLNWAGLGLIFLGVVVIR